MGNDDYTPTKRMTGGTLPALLWHNVMTYAHQGVELRPLPGLPPIPPHAPSVADAALLKESPAPQQLLLTRKATDALIRIEHSLDDASHALSVEATPAGTLGLFDGGETRGGTVTAASELKPAGFSRGN
jgi:penicillin-binding protein 1A